MSARHENLIHPASLATPFRSLPVGGSFHILQRRRLPATVVFFSFRREKKGSLEWNRSFTATSTFLLSLSFLLSGSCLSWKKEAPISHQPFYTLHDAGFKIQDVKM